MRFLILFVTILISLSSNSAFADDQDNMLLAEKYIKNKEYKRALKILPKIKGELRGQALLYLSDIHGSGSGVKKDMKFAKLLLKRHEKHMLEFAADSLRGVTSSYGGKNVEKNPQKAIEIYKALAFRGSKRAYSKLYYHYIDGKIVEKNPNLAFEFLARSVGEQKSEEVRKIYFDAIDGNKEAQYKLASSYISHNLDFTRYFPHDRDEAIKWYTLSINQGSLKALYELGLLYYWGDDRSNTPPEKEKGLTLISAAANNGYKKAQDTLNRIADRVKEKAAQDQAMQNLVELGLTILRNIPDNRAQSSFEQYEKDQRERQQSINLYENGAILLLD